MLQQPREFYEFGPFRLDPSEHLLLANGKPVPLPPKAFDTLTTLVRQNGHLLDKEQIMKAVWPNTFVEEANVAQNIALLRKALSEHANGDLFIETVPKRGYRFVAAVRNGSEVSHKSQVQKRDKAWPAIAAVTIAMIVCGAAVFSWRAPNLPGVLQRQITANPAEDPVFRASISPDGKYLAYTDLGGLHLRLIDTGESRSLPLPRQFCFR